MSGIENTYRWKHPDVIQWERDGQPGGYAFRRWVQLSLSFDYFTITRTRNFFESGSMGILTSSEAEEAFAEYAAMSSTEQAAHRKDKRHLENIHESKSIDGFVFHGRSSFHENDRIAVEQVEDFDGKESEPWHYADPYYLSGAQVALVPFGRKHGGMYRTGNRGDVLISISVEPDMLSGVLGDLNASAEKKRIDMTFQVLLYEFAKDYSSMSGGGFGERPSQSMLMPHNVDSVPAVLSGIDVVLYEREPIVAKD